MKIIIFTCIVLISWQMLPAQPEQAIDSMIQLTNQASEDTNKVGLLSRLGKLCLDHSRNEEAKKYLLEAEALGKKLNYSDGLITNYFLLGLLFRNESDFSQAFKNLEASLDFAKESGNKPAQALALYAMGGICNRMNNHEEALKYLLPALDIAKESDDKQMLANIHGRTGLAYDFHGNYPKAMEHYRLSMKFGEEIGDKFSVAAANMNIGCVYSYMGDYSAVLEHNLAALEIWKEMGRTDKMTDTYVNIAEAYACMCDVVEAEKYAYMGIELAKELNYKPAIGTGLNILGVMNNSLGNHENAIRNYKDALAVWKEEGDKEKIATTTINVGNGYSNLEMIDEAITYYNEGLKLSEEIGNKLNMQDAYLALSNSYRPLGNYAEALHYSKLYRQMKDTLWNQNNRNIIIDIEQKYEAEKKDQEIALLNKEKTIRTFELNKQKQTIQYFITGIGLLGLLSFVVYRNYSTRQELKLQTLRNKIAADLHDEVGSTLSSISIFSQMAQGQSKEVIPALETIYESSRKMLDAITDIVWTINPENDQFEKIIMRMRTFAYELLGAKQIDYQFMVDDEVSSIKLPMQARKNLYLIFKEATNNMVKYAQANQAIFSIQGKMNMVTMIIRDNGKGFDATKESNGNGLKNMQKRAAEIGAQLWIDSMPGSGTTIKLELAA